MSAATPATPTGARPGGSPADIEAAWAVLTGMWGAWEAEDGESCLINNVNGSLRDMPVEVLETLFPVTVTEYAVRPDSGGASRTRSGNGVVREYRFEADQNLSLWWERSVTPAWDVFGGADGAPPAVRLNPGRAGRTSVHC